MPRKSPLKFDEIGQWSEIKLDIVRDYAKAYSTILTAQSRPKLHHVYIDGFAGAGIHLRKKTKDIVPGSPLNALLVQPPFREFFFIDLDATKAKSLKEHTAERTDVHVFEGDCNEILLKEVFPHVRFEDYRRGLCLLDPYGLHLRWHVIGKAGEMKSIDMFLNFPVMDMNRNALWKNPEAVDTKGIRRMNEFWGDDSWQRAAYKKTPTLFEEVDEKRSNEDVAEAFRERLKKVAGFKHVVEPLAMMNSRGAVVYYLFFASQKAVADDIITAIFEKYRS
jgi:three-Cys-motif partner protein